ncbi:hypothetical protein H0H81_012074, partial [Sphagnurus paluster]
MRIVKCLAFGGGHLAGEVLQCTHLGARLELPAVHFNPVDANVDPDGVAGLVLGESLLVGEAEEAALVQGRDVQEMGGVGRLGLGVGGTGVLHKRLQRWLRTIHSTSPTSVGREVLGPELLALVHVLRAAERDLQHRKHLRRQDQDTPLFSESSPKRIPLLAHRRLPRAERVLERAF